MVKSINLLFEFGAQVNRLFPIIIIQMSVEEKDQDTQNNLHIQPQPIEPQLEEQETIDVKLKKVLENLESKTDYPFAKNFCYLYLSLASPADKISFTQSIREQKWQDIDKINVLLDFQIPSMGNDKEQILNLIRIFKKTIKDKKEDQSKKEKEEKKEKQKKQAQAAKLAKAKAKKKVLNAENVLNTSKDSIRATKFSLLSDAYAFCSSWVSPTWNFLKNNNFVTPQHTSSTTVPTEAPPADCSKKQPRILNQLNQQNSLTPSPKANQTSEQKYNQTQIIPHQHKLKLVKNNQINQIQNLIHLSLKSKCQCVTLQTATLQPSRPLCQQTIQRLLSASQNAVITEIVQNHVNAAEKKDQTKKTDKVKKMNRYEEDETKKMNRQQDPELTALLNLETNYLFP